MSTLQVLPPEMGIDWGHDRCSNESAYRATINDVREYDEELNHGLLKLKNYTGDVETDFSLDFTATDTITVIDEQGRSFIILSRPS